MSKIILQPAGDGDAREHFIDTIEHPVSLDRIKPYVSQEIYTKLKNLYPNSFVPVWGVTPGHKEVNKRKWERVESGDIALFSRDKVIFASATVAFTTHNKKLALNLWQTNPEGETWEYIYFLDEITNQYIPYEHFNRAVGYKENNIIQGFNVLDSEKSLKVAQLLDLKSEIYFPEVSKEDYFKAVSEPSPEEPLDRVSQTKARIEQAYLRNNLFSGKKNGICGICNKEFPVNFLVAAHIKKRADCTETERRDYKNIIMPMCKFGCDELYEKGYIYIEKGKVVASLNKYITPRIKDYLDEIININCSYWAKATEKYFSWHSNLHKNDL